jgi:hypothetical protein
MHDPVQTANVTMRFLDNEEMSDLLFNQTLELRMIQGPPPLRKSGEGQFRLLVPDSRL